MNNYLKSLDEETRKYLEILSEVFPVWLEEYIETPEMQRLKTISQACGTDYTKLYKHNAFYNILDHSVGCCLIVWNFTKNKTQALAALFHDISTPTFKHCIDFFNGDYDTQESTEDLTTLVIKNSKEIMALLERDNIKLEEINDYHIYPIADNDSPRLASDRLEYTFQNGMKCNYGIKFSLNDIALIYNDLEILKNEDNEDEIGFKNKNIAEKFVSMASVLWPNWCNNRFKITGQFFAAVVKMTIDEGELSITDLYYLTESEVIDKIKMSRNKRIREGFNKFANATKIYESNIKPLNNNYCVSFNCKKRYINPLVRINEENKRIYNVSKLAKEKIDDFLNFETKKYVYFDFNL